MLEFKAQASNRETAGDPGPEVSAGISQANLLRIETSRTTGTAKRGWFADLDFLGAITALFGAAWSTDRAELQPIPVRIRDRL
jgi:hypothetical protein